MIDLKRIISILMIMVLMSLTGCVNTNNTEVAERLTYFNLTYRADKNDSDSLYKITINFEDEEIVAEVWEHKNNLVEKFDVEDIVNLKAYLDKIKNDPEIFNDETDKSISAKDVLWDLTIQSEITAYHAGGVSDYPKIWEELFETLIDCSDAEKIQDFGINKSTNKIAFKEKTFEEKTEQYKKELDYPAYISDNNKYVKVNKLITDAIFGVDAFNMDVYDENTFINFYGEYEIMLRNEEMLCFKYIVDSNIRGGKSLENCYGITVDLNSEKQIALCDNYNYDELISMISNKEYVVESGAFFQMNTDEILKEVKEDIFEVNYDMYKDNFYTDGIYNYLIVNNVIGSDYSILKFPLK